MNVGGGGDANSKPTDAGAAAIVGRGGGGDGSGGLGEFVSNMAAAADGLATMKDAVLNVGSCAHCGSVAAFVGIWPQVCQYGSVE